MQRYSISYPTFKTMITFLSTIKVYFIQTDTQYTLVMTDLGRQSCWTCSLLRAGVETSTASANVTDFETNVKPDAILCESIDDAVAQHTYS